MKNVKEWIKVTLQEKGEAGKEIQEIEKIEKLEKERKEQGKFLSK